MKKTTIILVMIAFCGSLSAQSLTTLSKKEQKALLKEQRAMERAVEEERIARLVELMVEQKQFVLEANMLYDKYGQSLPVQSVINFILVDSIRGTIQIGNPNYIGTNGLGGITLDGSLHKYEYEKNEKRGIYNINFMVRATTGSYDVNMTVGRSGNADATVRGNFGGTLRYSGVLVHPSVSKVFKGREAF